MITKAGIDAAARKAKATSKPVRIHHNQGLYILVKPNGSRLWRIDYRFRGKRKTLSLGSFPEVKLQDARARRDEIREQVAHDIDPSAERKAQKIADNRSDTFEFIAREWIGRQTGVWSTSHGCRVLRLFERDVFPCLGGRRISEITAPEILSVFRRVEDRNAIETAHRGLQKVTAVFTYAVASGLTPSNPARELRGTLTPVKATHLAAITDASGVGALMRSVDGYTSFLTRSALLLLAYTFVRPGELRQAEWTEFDLDNGIWRIPAHRMKRGIEHVVPLSHQSAALLREIEPLTRDSKYVFPSVRTNQRCMSENTLTAALRRLGYTKKQMTAHGFRSIASTMLNEQGWTPDAVERQLSHVEAGKVRAAYHRTQYMPERIKMMQHWANHLDNLTQGAKVVAIHSAKRKTASER